MNDVILNGKATIEKNVQLGYNRLSKLREGYKIDAPVILGKDVTIRSGSIIYAGCEIGDGSHVGHNTVLREFTKLGKHSSIGSGVVCEGYTNIGDYTTVHAQTHLTARMIIGNYVFIGPHVVTMNDKRIRYYRPDIEDSPDIGPTISSGVAVGSAAVILPQVTIQIGVLIAAGSVVVKDCQPFRVYMGVPAKEVRSIYKEEVVTSLLPFYKQHLIDSGCKVNW